MSNLIVSLTFDDALDSHLDIAVPMLEERGFHGTFFVNLNAQSFAGRLFEWQAIAQKGHELGNHTIFHPAILAKSYISKGNALENYSLDRMRIELQTANQLLFAIDGRQERPFAYPCSNPILGQPGMAKRLLRQAGLERTRIAGWVHKFPFLDVFSREKNYSCLLPELFYTARGGGFGSRSKVIDNNDRYFVPCVSADGLKPAQLQENLNIFLKEGNWLVFMFHGIGSGHHLVCEHPDFGYLLDKLSDDREISVLPFLQAARMLWGKSADA